MTVALVHSSSCCLNDFFCSDICLSLSASLNALAAGSLPCSLHPHVQPPGALPCHRPSRPTGTRRWRVILASALIRQGGGYNEKAASKAVCLWILVPLQFGAVRGRWPEGLILFWHGALRSACDVH